MERPSLPRAALHVGALWAFALAQPLYDLLDDQPQFFVARGNDPEDVLAFVAVWGFLAPLAVAAVVALIGRVDERAGRFALVAVLGALVAVFALPPAGDLVGGATLPALAIALAAGAAFAALYAARDGVRTVLTVLSPAPLAFALLFVLVSPVRDVVLETGAPGKPVEATSRTPVVMVVFDELPTTTLLGPDGEIDARRFPSFARLAERSTFYRNAFTVRGGTVEALPSLLTGNRIETGELPTASDHPRSLFTLLGRSHTMHVEEPFTDVCPQAVCGVERKDPVTTRLKALRKDLTVVLGHVLLPDDARRSLPSIQQAWEGFDAAPEAGDDAADPIGEILGRLGADDPTTTMQRFVDGIAPPAGDRPPLHFIHLGVPHVPWRFLPDGRRYRAHKPYIPGLLASEEWMGDEYLVEQATQRHILQSQYADRLLGQLLDKLEQTGTFDPATVVVVADHGIGLRPGEKRRGVSRGNVDQLAEVPLFVKEPGRQEGAVSDVAARSTDVLPTISQLTGVDIPWEVDGVPAPERNDDPEQAVTLVHDADRVSIPFGEFVSRREALLRERAELLGAETSYPPTRRDPIYAIGPRPDLVGRRLPAALARTDAGPENARARIDGFREFAFASGSVVPAYVSGDAAAADPGDALAIAVNGRIEATTRAYSSGDDTWFSAMIPPASLRGAGNAVAVLAIGEGDRLEVLAQVRDDPARLKGDVLIADGRRLPLRDGAVQGYVENVFVDIAGAHVTGWAGTHPEAPDGDADAFYVFADGRLLWGSAPDRERPDLAAVRPDLETPGWEAFVAPEDLVGAKRLDFIAVVDGRAGRMERLDGFDAALAALPGGG